MRPHTIFWLLLFFLLAACSSVTETVVLTPTPVVPAPLRFSSQFRTQPSQAHTISLRGRASRRASMWLIQYWTLQIDRTL